MADRGDYEVGFGKPPKHTRFAPGQSGNPSGRRKPRPTVSEQLDRILGERVNVTEGGQSRRITKTEVFLRQLVNKAITGDRQFGILLLGYLRQQQEVGGMDHTDETDAFLLEQLKAMYADTGGGA